MKTTEIAHLLEDAGGDESKASSIGIAANLQRTADALQSFVEGRPR
jgi:hypothetical protein